MISPREIDAIADLWNRTKKEKYRILWYKKIREWANGKNFSDTDTAVRWDIDKRKS